MALILTGSVVKPVDGTALFALIDRRLRIVPAVVNTAPAMEEERSSPELRTVGRICLSRWLSEIVCTIGPCRYAIIGAMEIAEDIQIAAAPADVAAIMFDPVRDAEWMTSVQSAVPQSAGISVGAQVDRTSVVSGREIAWTTRVAGFHFPHVLRLSIGGGQTGGVHYEVQRAGTGSVARVRASAAVDLFGFSLERLKALVEARRGDD
jgi:carbon monoxide dehydrogenase subunit G